MSLLAPHFLDCVVAIGFTSADATTHWAASGFFFGRFSHQTEENTKMYDVYLATNRHVFENEKEARVRFNPLPEGPAGEYLLPLTAPDGSPIWRTHDDPRIDVAVTPISAGLLQSQGIQLHFFQDDLHVADMSKCRELGVSEGDDVYALGFPMGLVGERRNYVIVREGAIARIRDALAGSEKEFLVDTFIFPGNSGGPVVIRPEVTAIEGTKPLTTTYLIGIITGYVPYQDVAFSRQTGRPRVIFEENSGLASAHPIDYLIHVIDVSFPKPQPLQAPTPENVEVPSVARDDSAPHSSSGKPAA